MSREDAQGPSLRKAVDEVLPDRWVLAELTIEADGLLEGVVSVDGAFGKVEPRLAVAG